MSEQWGATEEELVRDAAVCPRLSADLRARVIGTALRSRRRHILRRSALWAACLLLSVTGLASWHYGMQGSGRGVSDPFAQTGDVSSGESARPAACSHGIHLEMQGLPIILPERDAERDLRWLFLKKKVGSPAARPASGAAK